MTGRKFLYYLALVTFGALSTASLLPAFIAPVREHGLFSVYTALFFIAVSTVLYFLSQNAVKSANKYAFNQLVSLSVFGKMGLSLALLFLYRAQAHPTNEWYVAIFFLFYIVYTAFEVWFMTRIAKS